MGITHLSNYKTLNNVCCIDRATPSRRDERTKINYRYMIPLYIVVVKWFL